MRYESEYYLRDDCFEVLKNVLTIISIIRLVIPYMNLFYEEEIMDYLSVFDLDLIPWIFFICILGKQLKKMTLPSWLPSTPVLLLLASFTVCALFGFAHTQIRTAGDTLKVVLGYGVGNGAFVGLLAMGGYDICHAWVKNKSEKVVAWFKQLIAKIKANKEAKE